MNALSTVASSARARSLANNGSSTDTSDDEKPLI
jgi:hypothetical protein